MKTFVIALLAISLAAISRADTTHIPVIGQGWTLSFDGPPITWQEFKSSPDGYSFLGNGGRLNVSVYVEPPQSPRATHKEVREFYWAKASQNPLIDSSMVKFFETDNYSKVTYMVVGNGKSAGLLQFNANYFFSFEGKWVDVHISLINPTKDDVELFQTLNKSLSWTLDKDSKPGAASFNIGDKGTVRMTLPQNWAAQGKTVGKPGGEVLGYTVEVSNPKAENASCQTSFTFVPPRPNDQESVNKIAKEAGQQFASGSVENAVNLKEFKPASGFGAYAVFTDASLVGKPVSKGNAKVMASGLVKLRDDVIGPITMLADDENGEDMKTMIGVVNSICFESKKADGR